MSHKIEYLPHFRFQEIFEVKRRFSRTAENVSNSNRRAVRTLFVHVTCPRTWSVKTLERDEESFQRKRNKIFETSCLREVQIFEFVNGILCL
jgi:hypothetical protein